MSRQSIPAERENFLLSILQKLVHEYRMLFQLSCRKKLFKIIEITRISSVPGETLFLVQLTNKNCVLPLTAAHIIGDNYDLRDFSQFHADMIRQAAQGKLLYFLRDSEPDPLYRIAGKSYDHASEQYIFTIETKDRVLFKRSATELARDKAILFNMDVEDAYDIGYTQGSESILKEKMALVLARNRE